MGKHGGPLLFTEACPSPPLPLQIIASINPPSTVGRHALSTRFTARVRIHSMSYPGKDAMQTIFTRMLEKVRGGGGGAWIVLYSWKAGLMSYRPFPSCPSVFLLR